MGREDVEAGVKEALALVTAWLNRDVEMVQNLVDETPDVRRLVMALACTVESLLTVVSQRHQVTVEELWRDGCTEVSRVMNISWERE